MTVPPSVVQLVLLTALAFSARRLFMQATAAPTAAASMVMAIGVFGCDALPQLAAALPTAGRFIAIGLLVVWGFLAVSYVMSWLDGTFGRHLASPVGRFAIGSWVAATAVLLRLLLLQLPEWRTLAMLLGILACGIWLWFLIVAVKGLRAVLESSSRSLVPAVVLLSTVSTQSLAIALFDLFPGQWSLRWLAAAFMALGVLFYVVGAVLVVRSHLKAERWTLADDWDNTNCILHGAMSITGLAVIIWNAAPPAVVLGLWLYVLCVFTAVEVVEVVRLAARVRAYGWRRGVFSYHVTQWSRNFTFGMFYAFTHAFAQQRGAAAEPGWVDTVQAAILAWGPYAVLLLLLFEIALFLENRLDRAAVASAVRRLIPRG